MPKLNCPNWPGIETNERRAVRPIVEGLEARLCSSVTLAINGHKDSRIRLYHAHGTSVGGVPSALFQTLNGNTRRRTSR